MEKNNINESSFEEKLKKLEEIVEILDSGTKPIEELLKYYEDGMAIARQCREFIEKAEQKVIDITKQNEFKPEKNNDEVEREVQ